MKAIQIKDHGTLLVLDYEGFLLYHGGDALAGAAIGYRAMEYAGGILSKAGTWDRKHLSVTTWHGGPGIRDAIEYVTRCVTRARFMLEQPDRSRGALAAFRFVVADDRQQARIALRAGVMPQRFFDLARLIRENREANRETAREREELNTLKAAIAQTVMAKSLDELFTVESLAIEQATVSENA